ncbi:MAG: hypothetical protein WBG92_16515 [Thiohalocapsa sp.]
MHTGHPIVDLGAVVDMLAADPIHRDAALMQLPTQRIAVAAARFHDHRQLSARLQRNQSVQNQARLHRVAPLDAHEQLATVEHHGGHEVFFGHVHGKQHLRPLGALAQLRPVNGLAILHPISTFTHGGHLRFHGVHRQVSSLPAAT